MSDQRSHTTMKVSTRWVWHGAGERVDRRSPEVRCPPKAATAVRIRRPAPTFITDEQQVSK